MKRRITKIMALALTGIMVCSFAACGSQTGTDAGTTAAEENTAAAGESTSVEENAVTESAETEEISGTMDGGFEMNSGSISLDENADAKAAFEKATETMDGSDYEPVALLGTQVVAGTNYAILCRITAVTPEAEPEFGIVYIYEDLDGNAELTEVKNLEL